MPINGAYKGPYNFDFQKKKKVQSPKLQQKLAERNETKT